VDHPVQPLRSAWEVGDHAPPLVVVGDGAVGAGDVHDPFEQPALAAQGQVDRLRGDAGAVRHRRDGRAGIAAVDEELERGFQDPPAGLLRLIGSQSGAVGAAGGLDCLGHSTTVVINSLQLICSGLRRIRGRAMERLAFDDVELTYELSQGGDRIVLVHASPFVSWYMPLVEQLTDFSTLRYR